MPSPSPRAAGRALRAVRTRLSHIPRPRTRWLVAGATAAVLVASGAVVASAHKSITLDVDGELTTVSTFAGSVGSLLEQQGLSVGERDAVAPGPAAELRSGDEVVIRYGRILNLVVDGEPRQVWSTAITAQEALGDLATRGQDVLLVASRAAGGGRPNLAVELTPGTPVNVVVDGETRTLRDGAQDVPTALEALGIELGTMDRVSVRPQAGGEVALVVQRVQLSEVADVQPVDFERTTTHDASRYTDQRSVTQAGAPGERTIVHELVLVDGVEESRRLLSDAVTTAPVAEVTTVGTKKRPVVRAAPRAAAPRVDVGRDAAGLNWGALAACESGGNPSIVSRTGKYHGLYQFSVATWQSVGGSGLPSQASVDEQTMRAQMLYSRSGAGQWPTCGPRLFS